MCIRDSGQCGIKLCDRPCCPFPFSFQLLNHSSHMSHVVGLPPYTEFYQPYAVSLAIIAVQLCLSHKQINELCNRSDAHQKYAGNCHTSEPLRQRYLFCKSPFYSSADISDQSERSLCVLG